MARTKQHPNIGKFTTFVEGNETDPPSDLVPYGGLHATAEEALESRLWDDDHEDGTVIGVYALVGLKVVRKPTLTENLSA